MIRLFKSRDESRYTDTKRKRAVLIIGDRVLHVERKEVEQLSKDCKKFLMKRRRK